MLELHLQLHTWPDGFREDMEYEVTPMIAELTAEHARKAKELGIPPEKHIRNVLAVPGSAPALDGLSGGVTCCAESVRRLLRRRTHAQMPQGLLVKG